jgi:hypothetical protein
MSSNLHRSYVTIFVVTLKIIPIGSFVNVKVGFYSSVNPLSLPGLRVAKFVIETVTKTEE